MYAQLDYNYILTLADHLHGKKCLLFT